MEELGRLCKVTDGTHYTPPNVGGPFPFLTVKDMTGNGLSFSACSWISKEEFIRAQEMGAVPEPGTVLFSKDGTVGKTHVVRHERPFAALSSIALLQPEPARLNSEYLAYALQHPRILRSAEDRKTGSALQRIILKDLKRVQVPIPSLTIQERVVARLLFADRCRRTQRSALEMSEGLLGAVFLEMFGQSSDTSVVTIEECLAEWNGSIRTGPFGSQLLHSEFTDSGVAVLGIDNAVHNRFEWDVRRYIPAEKYLQLKRYTVRPGDVLITLMGTCGRCAIVPNDIPVAINTKHLCAMSLNHSRCLPVFLHGAFLFDSGIRRQLRAATKGAIMEGLNMQIIRDLKLSLPPPTRQQAYSRAAATIEKIRRVAEESLRQAEHLFQTLLHVAFGEA